MMNRSDILIIIFTNLCNFSQSIVFYPQLKKENDATAWHDELFYTAQSYISGSFARYMIKIAIFEAEQQVLMVLYDIRVP